MFYSWKSERSTSKNSCNWEITKEQRPVNTNNYNGVFPLNNASDFWNYRNIVICDKQFCGVYPIRNLRMSSFHITILRMPVLLHVLMAHNLLDLPRVASISFVSRFDPLSLVFWPLPPKFAAWPSDEKKRCEFFIQQWILKRSPSPLFGQIEKHGCASACAIFMQMRE